MRNELELPLIANDTLVERLLGNADVAEHAEGLGRIVEDNMLVSKLENIMNRYHVRLHNFINVGIDDNHPYRENEWVGIGDLGPEAAEGRFQIFFLKDAEPITYPREGPLDLIFEYDLNEERV